MSLQKKNIVSSFWRDSPQFEENRLTNSLSKSRQPHQRNSVTLAKKRKNGNQNISLPKTSKNRTKVRSSLNRLIKVEKAKKNQPRKRALSEISSKGPHDHSLEKQQKRYILNSVNESKARKALSLKGKGSVSSLHNKSYSNQTVLRNTGDQKTYFLFNNPSISQSSKIKKKKHDYIKKFNKTSQFQASLSTGFNSVGHRLNQTLVNLNVSKYNQIGPKNIINEKMYCQQINRLKNSHDQKLKQIKLNTNNLFKKIKNKTQKEKLSLITNGYDKIVSQLYTVLAHKCSIPHCEISRINTNGSNIFEHSNLQANHQNQNYDRNKCQLNSYQNSFGEKARQAQIVSESEHWDSYLDCGQVRGAKHVSKSSSLSLIKKLNLEEIRKQPIKQYHEQFMEQKQYFSDSWKRQLSKQRKF